jgi:hypothetical protein
MTSAIFRVRNVTALYFSNGPASTAHHLHRYVDQSDRIVLALQFFIPMLTITSTVPTKDQVLIPESLLKKRKTQEKTQVERDQALAEKKKVQFRL